MFYLIEFKTYGKNKKAVKTFEELKKDCEKCNGAFMGRYSCAREMIKHLFENVENVKKTRSWAVANKFIFGKAV